MISEFHIDRFALALTVDEELRSSFLADRLTAIDTYNRGCARRFGAEPIELSEEEKRLLVCLQADSIESVYELLVMALDEQGLYGRTLTSGYGSSQELTTARNPAA